jgi:hypothetical protein
MGHEDFVMMAAIGLSIFLQVIGGNPDIPSWLPAVSAGLYKYSVDVYRDKKNGGNGNGKVGKIVLKTNEVEVVADRIEVRPE